MACDLYCCLLPKFEASRAFARAFLSLKMVLWPRREGSARCCLHKKNVQSGGFVVKRRDVVPTSPLALRWMCDSPWIGCARGAKNNTHIYVAWTREWSWHVISIVSCSHSVKLCPLVARAFQSQQCRSYLNMNNSYYLVSPFLWNFRQRIWF